MRGQFFVTLMASNGGVCIIEKLVSLGFTQQMAEDIIWAYQDDLPGLKAYVRVIEIVAAHV